MILDPALAVVDSMYLILCESQRELSFTAIRFVYILCHINNFIIDKQNRACVLPKYCLT